MRSLLMRFRILPCLLAMSATSFPQPPAGTNFDESKVPPYRLPDPLLMADGRKVRTVRQWEKIQRPALYRLFEENVYGRYPTRKISLHWTTMESGKWPVDTSILRKVVRIRFGDDPKDTATDAAFIDLLLFLPANASGPVPVFLGYNFQGNAKVGKDESWPVREILSQGIGLATAWYEDVEPDNAEGWKTGIRGRLQKMLAIKPEEWSALGAWAWGLSRIMDYLEKDPAVDAHRVALMGHSRLGKAALWAGASDRRFSIVISNESGEGGAALSRRIYGETIRNLNERFPWWFTPGYKKYNDHADSLPVDQHELLALQAPRPLYVASAEEDRWSDPKGEFTSAVGAGEVYALFGKPGIGTDSFPPLHQPVGQTIRYHIRAGKHGVTLYDWQQYLAFAERQWGKFRRDHRQKISQEELSKGIHISLVFM